jgi:hypothetical protein
MFSRIQFQDMHRLLEMREAAIIDAARASMLAKVTNLQAQCVSPFVLLRNKRLILKTLFFFVFACFARLTAPPKVQLSATRRRKYRQGSHARQAASGRRSHAADGNRIQSSQSLAVHITRACYSIIPRQIISRFAKPVFDSIVCCAGDPSEIASLGHHFVRSSFHHMPLTEALNGTDAAASFHLTTSLWPCSFAAVSFVSVTG